MCYIVFMYGGGEGGAPVSDALNDPFGTFMEISWYIEKDIYLFIES